LGVGEGRGKKTRRIFPLPWSIPPTWQPLAAELPVPQGRHVEKQLRPLEVSLLVGRQKPSLEGSVRVVRWGPLYEVSHHPQGLVRESLHYQAVSIKLSSYIHVGENALYMRKPESWILRPKLREFELRLLKLLDSFPGNRILCGQSHRLLVIGHIQAGSPV
jgi:hypothetical protein